jgi:glycosyltransferase involved in cell wall biosynthesis
MKVLITSPSLDENENVSGISTMVSAIMKHVACEFVLFKAGRKDGEVFDLAWLVKQVKLPFLFRAAIMRSRPDLIHINTAFEPRSIIRDLVLVKSAGRRPVVLHLHGGRFLVEDFSSGVLASMAGKLLRAAHLVIVLSDAEAEIILKRTPHLKVSVLPNAVATGDFPEIERLAGTKTVIYHGRLQEVKGLSEIVESCRLLRAQGFDFTFTCYGTGPDQDEFFRRMTNVLGDKFHYGGIIAGSKKIEALNAADIFLLPSRFEGLPVALLEAMAAGCIPIVSNRGSSPLVVEDGRNGFLVDPGDITQIVGKLKFLLSEGETGWAEYRRNARETVRRRFNISDYSKHLESIYRDVTAPR